MNDIKNLSDIQLVTHYKSGGNPQYVGELYRRYSKLCFLICLKYLKNSSDAQEAGVQVFENILHSLKKYNVDNFRNWLMTVCRNHCFYLLKQEQKIRDFNTFFEKNSEEFVEFESEFYLYGEKDSRETRFEQLSQAMNRLPDMQKECLRLFFWEGRSYADIQQKLNLSAMQVKSAIQNGKRRLKIMLGNMPVDVWIVALFVWCCLN